MGEAEVQMVMRANDAWAGQAPTGSEVIETSEYRLVRFPEHFGSSAQVQWVRSSRQPDSVLQDIVARAAELGQTEVWITVRLSSPAGLDEALLARGAELGDTCEVVAQALPADVKAPEVRGLEVRWLTTPETGRDANTLGNTIFSQGRATAASDEVIAQRAAEEREKLAAGSGGIVVAYLDGTPVAVSSLDVVDGVARMGGAGVLESHRGKGIYRALVATRLTYAADQGAVLALCQANITTSSPILKRLGFTSYGQERSYRLPLEQ